MLILNFFLAWAEEVGTWAILKNVQGFLLCFISHHSWWGLENAEDSILFGCMQGKMPYSLCYTTLAPILALLKVIVFSLFFQSILIMTTILKAAEYGVSFLNSS